MSSNKVIDFWFMVGSTYTYLTVSRLHQLEASTGIRFRWRPFNVRAIMQEMDNIPFATKPIKLAYMWRDIERRALKYGLPCRVPAPYPLTGLELANASPPDIILHNIGMPIVDGYRAGTLLSRSEKFSNTLLVAVTAYGRTDDLVRAKNAGFDIHILKPIELDDLKKVLKRGKRG